MHCFICNQPAIGQCQICWRFYCLQHGNRQCVECAGSVSRADAPRPDVTDTGPVSIAVHPLGTIRSSQLQRVIALGERQEYQGLILSLISVEVYNDGFASNFRLTFTNSTDARQAPGAAPVLMANARDALGTGYYAPSVLAMGPHGDWHASIRFEPALREKSDQLAVSVVKIEWLPQLPSSDIVKWFGPWTFQVPLS